MRNDFIFHLELWDWIPDWNGLNDWPAELFMSTVSNRWRLKSAALTFHAWFVDSSYLNFFVHSHMFNVQFHTFIALRAVNVHSHYSFNQFDSSVFASCIQLKSLFQIRYRNSTKSVFSLILFDSFPVHFQSFFVVFDFIFVFIYLSTNIEIYDCWMKHDSVKLNKVSCVQELNWILANATVRGKKKEGIKT